jgi:hypothetical protein
MTKIAGSGSESGSISQRHGSTDPDPPQIVMDPQHYYTVHTFSGEKKRAEERLEEEVRQRSDLAQEVTRLNTTINHKDIEVRVQWIEVSSLFTPSSEVDFICKPCSHKKMT